MNKECSGEKELIGNVTISDCAMMCKDKASLFAFGNIALYFSDDRRQCKCQKAATKSGKCERIENEKYNLYSYGKTFFYSKCVYSSNLHLI